jgi:hypothetical protein
VGDAVVVARGAVDLFSLKVGLTKAYVCGVLEPGQAELDYAVSVASS